MFQSWIDKLPMGWWVIISRLDSFFSFFLSALY